MDSDVLLRGAKSQLLQMYKSAIVSVLPGNLIQQQVRINGDKLIVNGDHHQLSTNIYVVGFGKAVEGMAIALKRILGERLRRGILSLPVKSELQKPSNFELANDPALRELRKQIVNQFVSTEVTRNRDNSVLERVEGAENNQPDENSLEASNKIIKLVKDLGKNDTLIVLVSGGGSALLVRPRKPLTLNQKRDITSRLQAAGANIRELNHVRKRLSSVKGGELARLAHPANVICLMLSDVIGDDCKIIASGPTCPLTPLEAGADPAEEVVSILKKLAT